MIISKEVWRTSAITMMNYSQISAALLCPSNEIKLCQACCTIKLDASDFVRSALNPFPKHHIELSTWTPERGWVQEAPTNDECWATNELHLDDILRNALTCPFCRLLARHLKRKYMDRIGLVKAEADDSSSYLSKCPVDSDGGGPPVLNHLAKVLCFLTPSSSHSFGSGCPLANVPRCSTTQSPRWSRAAKTDTSKTPKA